MISQGKDLKPYNEQNAYQNQGAGKTVYRQQSPQVGVARRQVFDDDPLVL
jgi:hypothetical protein